MEETKNIYICKKCRSTYAGYPGTKVSCPNCSCKMIDSGVPYKTWNTMTEEEKTSVKESSAPKQNDSQSRTFWLGVLRRWAKFMIVSGIIAAIVIGIMVGNVCYWNYMDGFPAFLCGAAAFLAVTASSVLIPAALMAFANMAEDIGDMRDRQMREK